MLGGACSGCAGSTMTLKMGVENMVKHYITKYMKLLHLTIRPQTWTLLIN